MAHECDLSTEHGKIWPLGIWWVIHAPHVQWCWVVLQPRSSRDAQVWQGRGLCDPRCVSTLTEGEAGDWGGRLGVYVSMALQLGCWYHVFDPRHLPMCSKMFMRKWRKKDQGKSLSKVVVFLTLPCTTPGCTALLLCEMSQTHFWTLFSGNYGTGHCVRKRHSNRVFYFKNYQGLLKTLCLHDAT